MCWTFSVRYNMYMYLSIHVFYLCVFCYLFIILSNWDNTFRKLTVNLIYTVKLI